MLEFSVINHTPCLFPFLLNLKMLTLINPYERLQVFLYQKPEINWTYLLLIHVSVLRRNILILKGLSASIHSLICCLRSLLAVIYVAKILVDFKIILKLGVLRLEWFLMCNLILCSKRLTASNSY